MDNDSYCYHSEGGTLPSLRKLVGRKNSDKGELDTSIRREMSRAIMEYIKAENERLDIINRADEGAQKTKQ